MDERDDHNGHDYYESLNKYDNPHESQEEFLLVMDGWMNEVGEL